MHPADAGSTDLGLIIGWRIGLQTVLRAVNAHPAHKNQHRQRRRSEVHQPLGQQAQAAKEIGCRNHRFRRSTIHQHTDKDAAQRAAELEQAGHHRRLLQRQPAGAENGWQPAVQQIYHEQPHKIGQPQRYRAAGIAMPKQLRHFTAPRDGRRIQLEDGVSRKLASKPVKRPGDLLAR